MCVCVCAAYIFNRFFCFILFFSLRYLQDSILYMTHIPSCLFSAAHLSSFWLHINFTAIAHILFAVAP